MSNSNLKLFLNIKSGLAPILYDYKTDKILGMQTSRPSDDFNPETITVNGVVWMAENLSVTDSKDGAYWSDKTHECYYTRDGMLRIVKNLEGWHIPTHKEWGELILAKGAYPIDDPTHQGQRGFYAGGRAIRNDLKIATTGSWYGEKTGGVTYQSEFVTFATRTSIDEHSYEAMTFYNDCHYMSGDTIRREKECNWVGVAVRLVKDY